MTFSLVRDGEFNVVTSANGGLCYVCNCRKQPGDLGIFRGVAIDSEGILDICQRCIVTAAQDLGMIGIAKAEELENLINEHENQINVLHQINEEQEKLIIAYRSTKTARERLNLPAAATKKKVSVR